jgi:hypothetical protein
MKTKLLFPLALTALTIAALEISPLSIRSNRGSSHAPANPGCAKDAIFTDARHAGMEKYGRDDDEDVGDVPDDNAKGDGGDALENWSRPN